MYVCMHIDDIDNSDHDDGMNDIMDFIGDDKKEVCMYVCMYECTALGMEIKVKPKTPTSASKSTNTTTITTGK